jgi:hypothetical protein
MPDSARDVQRMSKPLQRRSDSESTWSSARVLLTYPWASQCTPQESGRLGNSEAIAAHSQTVPRRSKCQEVNSTEKNPAGSGARGYKLEAGTYPTITTPPKSWQLSSQVAAAKLACDSLSFSAKSGNQSSSHLAQVRVSRRVHPMSSLTGTIRPRLRRHSLWDRRSTIYTFWGRPTTTLSQRRSPSSTWLSLRG